MNIKAELAIIGVLIILIVIALAVIG